MTRQRIMRRVRLKANALWEYLQRRHLTQQAFAALVPMSPGYLSELIWGESSPSPDMTRLMLDALDVEFDDLFWFEEIGGD